MSGAQNGARRALREVFGFDSFRPGQEEVIGALSDGVNVLAVMPTGAGKSLCYQIPTLLLRGLTLVVSPLISLMEDQVAGLRLAEIPAGAINSSHPREENRNIWNQAQYASQQGEPFLLYLSPERLMGNHMMNLLQPVEVKLAVVDEAHCISKWGPAFRPEYEALADLSRCLPGAAIGAFTATADETTRRDIADKLFSDRCRVFVYGFDRPNIHLAVEETAGRKRIAEYAGARAGQSGIVYCLSRKDTEQTAEHLRKTGINAAAYHAGMPTGERTEVQDEFMTRPGMVMAATIAFGMGIDKPDIRYVLHASLPGSVESYYQELGRAGRDGEPAEALMLYRLGDIPARRRMIDQDGEDNEQHRRREHQRLNALIGFCESVQCRRQVLLGYFGEKAEPCGNCDLCENPPQVEDGRQAAERVLQAVMATRQRFGQGHIVDVLTGVETAKVRQFEHDRLPAYGTGKEFSKWQWRSIIHQMVAGGFLDIDYDYGGLRITPQGGGLLRGDLGFRFRRPPEKPARTAARKRDPAPERAVLAEGDGDLFDRLKRLRLSIARERGVPAFVVFHDRTLTEMAARRPATPAQFADIPGVGAAKLRDFAEPFLAEIAAHRQEGDGAR